jgi:hypothetical protein
MGDRPADGFAASEPGRNGVESTEITEHDRVKIRPARGTSEPTEILHFEPGSRAREIAILIAALGIAASLIAGTWLLTRRDVDLGQGGVVVLSTPPDAEVLIDSVPLGFTPFSSSNMEAGKHTITVRRAGYQPIVGTVEISPHKIIELRYPLQPVVKPKP